MQEKLALEHQPRHSFLSLGWTRRHRITAFLFVLPALFLLLAITVYPLIRVLILSVMSQELTVSPDISYVGLSNFAKVITDERFWNAMRNTGYLVVVGVTVQLVVG